MTDTSKFQEFISHFESTQLWADMVATCENSPWHRESNVAEHTMMLYRWYRDNKMSMRSDRVRVLTFLSIMFHDTGKPAARKEKWREDRGTYYIYAGHEQISARLWEDYAVTNWQFLKHLFPVLMYEDIYKVGYIVENHLPFSDAKEFKQRIFRTALFAALGNEEEAYFDCLLSDQHGRISDDQEKKLADVYAWISKFKTLMNMQSTFNTLQSEAKVICLLIGASGSGKSTYVKRQIEQYSEDGVGVYSLDSLRLSFAEEHLGVDFLHYTEHERYRKAFDLSVTRGDGFNKYADKAFSEMLKKYDYILVDNVNVSRKSRIKWADRARNRGFGVAAVLFPISKKELLKRMTARNDKRVPEEAVLRQWNQISYPSIGDDVDLVTVYPGNF